MSALTLRPDCVPRTQACAALGVPRSRLYPDRRKRNRKMAQLRPQPRQLSEPERVSALTLMHSERFCDQAPRLIHANLLTEGTVVASVSTLYRLLRSVGEVQERRRQRPPQRHAVPRLEATAPNQVWTLKSKACWKRRSTSASSGCAALPWRERSQGHGSEQRPCA